MNRLTIIATDGDRIIRVWEDFKDPQFGLRAWTRCTHRLDKAIGTGNWSILFQRVHAAPCQPFRRWIQRIPWRDIVRGSTRCAW